MGVTNITKVVNSSNTDFYIYNAANSGDTGSFPGYHLAVGAPPFAHDMWIPWCTNSASFFTNRITITSASGPLVLFSIWQADESDGDHVRVSTDNQWHSSGCFAPGNDGVDGTRTVTLGNDHSGNLTITFA